MGKKNHINPILLPSQRKKNEQVTRKVRKDKLHDIKIPITETMDMILRREARKYWDGSKTSVGTDLITFGMEQMFIFPEVNYQDRPHTCHVKVDHEMYQRIGQLADKWKCRSIRQAAHRIFMEAFKKKQLGGIWDEEIQ
jgi:hypothetical protein